MTIFLPDLLPLWAMFLIACLIIGLPLWIGRKSRQLHQKHYGDVDSGAIGIVVGSLLGLLGFLLAFTFGMAGTRYEERRQAVLVEANVIGTSYLRADLLPDPEGSEVKRLLRQYVDIRASVAGSVMSWDALELLIDQSVAIHQKLWAVAATVAKADPTPVTGLVVQSINDVIDAHSNRVMIGMRSTIPIEIWIGLYVVAAISLGSAGFQWGSNDRQSIYPDLALVLTFAAVLTLVADLDNPARGFIKTDQFPILDLAEDLKADMERG